MTAPRVRDVRTLGHVDLYCTIERLGPEEPFPHGFAVECKHVSMTLRARLGDTRYPPIPNESVPAFEAGPGFVLDTAWHVDPLEMSRAKITPPRANDTGTTLSKAHILGAYEFMWYLVMFKRGHFWVRYDHVIPARAPQ